MGDGEQGKFLSGLKKFSDRKGVNNYKEKWKVVASKETTLTSLSFIRDLLQSEL